MDLRWPRIYRRPNVGLVMNEMFCNLIRISVDFDSEGLIENKSASVHVMAWHRTGGKPLSEPTIVSLLTHIYTTRPQWIDNMT